MTIDLNPSGLASISATLNELFDTCALKEDQRERRDYLGASSIGSECLRKVQFDWQHDSVFPSRTNRIFDRGHASEAKIRNALCMIGFDVIYGTAHTEFTAVNGQFRGHCDGIIEHGPAIEGLEYPCLWEHKCLSSSGWKKIEKHGLRMAYPHYYDQVQIYMAYLRLDDHPALFTAENADTCHLQFLTVPFSATDAQGASDRAVSVIRATANNELLPRITDKGPTDWRCKICVHSNFCWSDDADRGVTGFRAA